MLSLTKKMIERRFEEERESNQKANRHSAVCRDRANANTF